MLAASSNRRFAAQPPASNPVGELPVVIRKAVHDNGARHVSYSRHFQ